jgi:hypothetical protein
MDLSAAVDSTYMVQFTNNGLYVLNKTSGALVSQPTGGTPTPTSLYTFWCTNKGTGGYLINGYLADCPGSGPLAGDDVQIAHTSVYPGGRWVATAMSPGKTYLWLAFSKSNDPRGGWYLWSFQTCQDFSGSGGNFVPKTEHDSVHGDVRAMRYGAE